MNDDVQYYCSHSSVSNPKEYSIQLKKLPKDIKALCKIVQGLLTHETDGDIFSIKFPFSRFYELNLRYINKILFRVFELDNTPLTQCRELKDRVIATCRDFSLLLVSICRELGIAARLRSGFATYTFEESGIFSDHCVMEYWSDLENRWIVVDPMITPQHQDVGRYRNDINYFDVPKNEFFTAGQAWLAAREGRVTVDKFACGLNQNYRGLWYIRGRLLHDFAALNKWEMIIWDGWGYMYHEPPCSHLTNRTQLETLDALAKVLCVQNMEVNKLRQIWDENPNLRVPSIVTSYDRFTGPRAVEVM